MSVARDGGNNRIGVLALQGAFGLHADRLRALGAEAVEVRRPDHLAGIDGLVIPGGESTTMSLLLSHGDLIGPITELLDAGIPTFGTCAGMILLADKVLDGRADQHSFGAIDIDVRRNGYGRQVDSFDVEVDLDPVVAGGDGPFDASFIRAPVVERAGPDVAVLATADDRPVLCRDGSVLVAAFHPELSADLRIHRYFLEEVIRDVRPLQMGHDQAQEGGDRRQAGQAVRQDHPPGRGRGT